MALSDRIQINTDFQISAEDAVRLNKRVDRMVSRYKDLPVNTETLLPSPEIKKPTIQIHEGFRVSREDAEKINRTADRLIQLHRDI